MIRGWSTFRIGKELRGCIFQSVSYRWGNWGRGRSNDESRLTKLVSSAVRVESMSWGLPFGVSCNSEFPVLNHCKGCDSVLNYSLQLMCSSFWIFLKYKRWLSPFVGGSVCKWGPERSRIFSGNRCEPEYLLRVLCFGRYTFVHAYHFFCHTILHLFTLK